MEDVPEIPPSPLQHTVKLYSLPDVEHLPVYTDADSVPEDASNSEQSPLPQQLSIQLYALPDILLSENSDSVPDPQQLSISLYPLSDVGHSIDTHETVDELLVEQDPLPASHSVDLFAATDVLYEQPELSPLPTTHTISLFPGSDARERSTPSTIPSTTVDPSHISSAGVSVDQPMNVAIQGESLDQGMEAARDTRIQGSSHFVIGTDTETQPAEPEQTVIRNPEDEELEQNYADAEREIRTLSSVPYVGRVADVVGPIIERCRHTEHYQKSAYVMASKCLEVVTILNSKASWLGSTDLAENSNKLFEIFTNIQTFTEGWPRTKGAATLVGKKEVRLALRECENELELAFDLVQIRIDELRTQAYEWLARGEGEVQGEIKADRQVEILRLPKLMNSEVECEAAEPIMVGRNADLRQGMWLGQEKVAIKVLRYAAQSANRKRLEREISTWINLTHKNVLPFYGTFMTSDTNQVHLVRPWQEEGNVLDHAKLHPGANRHTLLRETAEALYYLHTNGVIHGNVKCANILMDEGRPKLCDFGITKLAEDIAPKEKPLPPMPVRWLSPERIEGGPPSREADFYAFAMTIVELVTGEHPYADCEEEEVKEMVSVHKRPPKKPEAVDESEALPDGVWSLMLDCWKPGAARHILIDLASALSASSRRGD